MLQIVLLTNLLEYPYHSAVSQRLLPILAADGCKTTILDINTFKHQHECLSHVRILQPDVLITLDLSGFRFRTQAGEIAFNMLSSKNLNLVWGNKAEYAPLLQKKLSLSMLFYDATGIDHKLPECYPNLLYYKALSLQNFPEIWDDFRQNVLL